jgi:myo-inositol-1(or 4)-monophosphatase
MQGDTGLVVDATRKASKSLQRDFFELENLQVSEKGTASFCQKSCGRAFQTLHESLNKYYKTVIFNNDEVASADFTGQAVLVETLDGLSNFERALPFFAIMATIVTKKDGKIEAERAIMNLPALGEIYYAEKGKGAWMERLSSNVTGASRTRVSGGGNVKNIVIAPSHDKMETAQKISSNIRFFDSYTYSLTQVIRGKIDAMIMSPRDISLPGIKLFLKESGGASAIVDDNLLASNFKLHEKIKQLL